MFQVSALRKSNGATRAITLDFYAKKPRDRSHVGNFKLGFDETLKDAHFAGVGGDKGHVIDVDKDDGGFTIRMMAHKDCMVMFAAFELKVLENGA